jgi:hypothetical protein
VQRRLHDALFDGNPATEAFGGNGGSGPLRHGRLGPAEHLHRAIDYDLGRSKNQLIVGVDLSRQENDKSIFAYTLPPGFTTRPGDPATARQSELRLPGRLRRVPRRARRNITCPATGNCTTDRERRDGVHQRRRDRRGRATASPPTSAPSSPTGCGSASSCR